MLLTIQQFSEKTGLSPSTLRFYDKKELLGPIAGLRMDIALIPRNK